MKLTKLTTAVMALAFAAVTSTSARAQISYSEGDLLLGFEQTNGVGGFTASDYVVDLGPVSQILNASSALTFNINTSDLQTAFGTTWATNSTDLVQWGLIAASDKTGTITVGGDSLLKNTLFESNAGAVPVTHSSSTQGLVDGHIQTFGGTDLESSNATAGTGSSAIFEPSSDTGGWTGSNPATAAFGSSYNIENVGSPISSVNFYELLNTTSTPGATADDLGGFSLNSSGTLTFTPTATPEPSSMALTGMAMTVMTLLVLRRRQSLANE